MRGFFLLLACILVCMGNTLTAQAQVKHEIRASWITTLGGMDWPRAKATSAAGIERQKKEFCNLLDRLKEANFNTILLQTRLRGDVIYPSQYERFAESLTGRTGRNPGYDPLAFAIEECHKRGMELHAWIVTIPIGNNRQVNLHRQHSVVKKHRTLCKQFRGSWYLDPGNPGTKDYLNRMVKEIIANYDVDGIHFDYIRYPEHGKNFPDRDTFRKYGKGKELTQWRRDNLTEIVSTLYTSIKALKPWIKVSSSPVGKYNDTNRYSSKGWNAYQTVYQDAQLWLKNGIHDLLFPMLYFKGNHFYPFVLDWKEHAYGRWIVPGLGVYFLSEKGREWPLEEINRQIYFSRNHGLNGQAFFRNQHLMDNLQGCFDELKETFYTTPALIPAMTWMDSIPPTLPQVEKVQLLPAGKVYFQWKAATDNKDVPVAYHLYASDQFPVNTEQGKNLIDTYLRDTTYTYQPSASGNRKRYFALTATDRFGNESQPVALNKAEVGDIPLLNETELWQICRKLDLKSIRFCRTTGETVLQLRVVPKANLRALTGGFYFVKGTDKTGKEMDLGTFLRSFP